jgi:hypothetical protein
MVTHGGPDTLSVGTKKDWLLNKDKETYFLVRQRPVVNTGPGYDRPLTDDDFGPPPGWTGAWPPPYDGMLAKLDLSHEGFMKPGTN